jgi:PAS domain S-box-containing protein
MIFLFTISAVSFFQDRPALVITGEDITEKKALLDAIKTSESNLRLITESVRDLIIRWESNGTISYVSPACELLTGYVSHELLGKNISDFIHPEDLPPYQHGDGEKNVNWSQLSSSFRFRTLKGKWIWFETTTTPRLSESGEIVDYISVWRDITAWLEAETRLALSEEKYRRLFEGAKDAIILMELTVALKVPSFVRLIPSPVSFLAIRSKISHAYLSDIIPPSMRIFRRNNREIHADEQGFFEIELLRKDGTVVPVEVNAHLFSLQGRMLVLAITRDITERRKHQAALMEAHQRLVDILEFLPDPVFVIDIEGKVTAWNRAMEELTGKRKEEIVGKGDYACAVAF